MSRPKKTSGASSESLSVKKLSVSLSTLKGMKDILPSERFYWQFIEDAVSRIRKSYSFQTIDTPLIEGADLYQSLIGSRFDDEYSNDAIGILGGKGKSALCLCPDLRTSVARAVVLHNLSDQGIPAKLSYSGQTFLAEKDKGGVAYRREYSVGFEVFGEQLPAVDAHLIMVGYSLLKELGLSVMISINSIGDLECRDLYKEALVDYFKQHKNKLDNEQKKLLRKDPIRLLSLEGKKYKDMIDGAPQIVDYLSESCKAHFFGVLEYLDDMNIPYNLDPTLLNDTNYYNRTVFEFYPIKDGDLSNVSYGMGGRYDYAVSRLSDKVLWAAGMSFNMDRLLNELKVQSVALSEPTIPDVFIAQIGDQACRRAMVLFEDLRKAGFNVMEGFVYNSLKVQLDIVNRLKIPYFLILGQKEVLDGTILLRDTEGGIQEVLDFNKVVGELKKRIKGRTS